jgi:hypothetical protein
MIIQKKEFQWARPLKPLNLSKVTAIAIHHMEHLTAGMDEIHQWHLARDNGTWKGFGYNFWVDFAGNVFECRGFNQGAGVTSMNSTVISVGFQGHYDKMKEMPQAQYLAGCELINYLKSIVPSIKLVAGHRYWENKSCPGKYFPLEEMIKMADTISRIKDYDKIADWAKSSVMNVVNEGIMIGDEQGQFNPTAPLTRQEVAVVLDRLLQKIKS